MHETQRLVKRVLSLPTGTAVDSDEIGKICQIIRLVVEHGSEVKERLLGHVAKEAQMQ